MLSQYELRQPDCAYYIVSDPPTQDVIVVVEARDEPEANASFAALRLMLRAAPDADIRVLGDATPPNGTPVFRLQYLKAIQARAEEEGRMPGAAMTRSCFRSTELILRRPYLSGYWSPHFYEDAPSEDLGAAPAPAEKKTSKVQMPPTSGDLF